MFIALGRLGGSTLRSNRLSTALHSTPTVGTKQQRNSVAIGADYSGSDLTSTLGAGTAGYSPANMGTQTLKRSALYVLGDKNQMKVRFLT